MKNTTIKSLVFFFLLCLTHNIFASTIPDYKHKTVQKIFNDLKAAKGIFPHEEPKLIFDAVFTGRGNLVFAYIDYMESAIHMEELIYDVCVQELGKDSLNGIAFMLGHELSHFLNRHESVAHHTPKDNVSLMGDKVLVDILKGRIENVDSTMLDAISTSIFQYKEREGEATADLEGGFITYLAGYASDRVEPTLPSLFLEKIYDAVGQGSQMSGYPRLEERQAIASSSKVVLDSLIHLYEMANALASIEHYEEAMTYYEILARTFESREIYNNMGVNAFLDATKCFKPIILPKKMPITLDIESRLEGDGRGKAASYDDLVRKKKLNTAIKYFEKAAQMDSEYPIAYLNLSVTRLLKAIAFKIPFDSLNIDTIAYHNQILLAKAAAIQAEMGVKELILKIGNSTQGKEKINGILSNVYIQLASIANEENKQDDYTHFMSLAGEVNPNNIFLDGEDSEPIVSNKPMHDCDKVETAMSGKNLIEIDRALKEKWSAPIVVKLILNGMDKEFQTFQKYEDDEIKVYTHKAKLNAGQETQIIILYPNGNASSACDIKIGSSYDEVKSVYGNPMKIMAVTGGSYVVFDKQKVGSKLHDGIVFFLDNSNLVKSWFIYMKFRS